MSARGFSSWLLSFVCTCLLMSAALVALFNLMDIADPALSVALAILLVSPIVWGLLMFYSYWDERPWRPAGVMTLLSLVSFAIVAVHWAQS